MISRAFKAILKVIGHLYCNFGLDRLFAPKNRFFHYYSKWRVWYTNSRCCFFDHNGTKFFKIKQKLTEIRHFKKYYFKGLWPFSHRILAIKLAKIISTKNPLNTCYLLIKHKTCQKFEWLSQKLFVLYEKN